MASQNRGRANYHQIKIGNSRNPHYGQPTNGNSYPIDKTERNSKECLCLEGAAFYGEHPSQHDLSLPRKLHIAHLDAAKPSLQRLRGIWCPVGLDSFYWEPPSGCIPYVLHQASGEDVGIYIYQNLYERQHKPPFSLFIGGENNGDYENLWEAIGEGAAATGSLPRRLGHVNTKRPEPASNL